MASEYEMGQLRAELSATQTSLYNLQSQVEQLRYAIEQAPSLFAEAMSKALAEERVVVSGPAALPRPAKMPIPGDGVEVTDV